MRSVTDIKHEVFSEPEYMIHEDIDWTINEVAKRYAIEASKEALSNAKERVATGIITGNLRRTYQITKAISCEENIPELL